MGIQQEFYENIGRVYMEEYSARDNCRIFIDILQGMDLDGLISKYTDFLFIITIKEICICFTNRI